MLVGLAVSPLSIAAQDVDEATLEEKRGPDLEWLEWSDVEWTSWLLGTHQGIDLGLKSSAGAPSEGSWMRLELDAHAVRVVVPRPARNGGERSSKRARRLGIGLGVSLAVVAGALAAGTIAALSSMDVSSN